MPRITKKILRLIEYAEKQSGLYKPLLCFLCIGLCISSVLACAKYAPLRLHCFPRCEQFFLRLIEYAEIMKAACLCRSLLDFCRVAVGFYKISAAFKALKRFGTVICCVYCDK